ncbi:MAG TPA: SCP2 sterol-binding domain-containing protein [Streptosporangiaceae bacterium]|jgi:hypothetical protein|nr:SCP2 sterol-binding domain-containing protein [Streptosporangiaceae bacterium]
MPTTSVRSRPAARSADPISEFFEGLAAPGCLDTFAGQSATVRFDVRDDRALQHWYVTVTRGDVAVSQSSDEAEATVMVDRPHLEAMVTGRLNAQAALLRGLLTCEGSMAMLIMFQRCLPGPRGSTGRVAPISSETVMAQRRPA